MSDLVNVYALLQSKFPENNFSLRYPPTYIRELTQNSDKIIFAFVEHDVPIKQERDMYANSPPIKDSSASDKLDLTGSPLKDDVILEELELTGEDIGSTKLWTNEEETLGPLSTEAARSLLQNYINQDCRIGSGELWALCSGTDMDRTVLLQLTVYQADAKNNRKFGRGIVRFAGQRPCASITLAELRSIHRQRAVGMTPSPKIHIRQWYSVHPQITIRLSWHTMTENASFTAESKASVRISQRLAIINIGNYTKYGSPTEYLWQQLQRLALLSEKIVDIRANRVSGYEMYGYNSNPETVEFIKEKVNSILCKFQAVELPDFTFTTIANMVEQVRNRNLTDVMERLFDVLILDLNYDDLKSCIDYIFQLAAHANIVNIPSKGTRFAHLIQAMIEDVPTLASAEPYELLLEVGFTKLMHDYQLIFAECGFYELDFESLFQGQLTNARKSRYNADSVRSEGKSISKPSANGRAGGLSQLVQGSDMLVIEKSIPVRHFDEDEVNMKLSRLAQVHLLVDHLLSLEEFINIPSIYGPVCEAYLAQRPLSYHQVYNRDSDLLELDVSEGQLISLTHQLLPYARRVSMSSSNMVQKLETVFYQNAQPILPDRFYPHFRPQEDSATSDEQMFWCLEYDRIERL
ncbi:protein zwilch-like [Anopheles albimanus]|uniref:Protein zwilch n=1 Tax=Anopheles albimanus TaxID=7167 RepID=A0A182FQ61_ANOAL|nr:protein zwilch-like [Anopheles albimanus]